MMADQMEAGSVYREAQRQKHKLLGAYMALYAWTRQVDCLLLPRDTLLEYLGLKKAMQEERLKWLKEDLSWLFTYFEPLQAPGTSTFAALILSRYPIPSGQLDDVMSHLLRAESLTKAGLKASIFFIPSESTIIEKLNEVARGTSDFSEW